MINTISYHHICQKNQYYQLRKAIHLKTKLIRSIYIINKYKIRSSQRQLLQNQINKLKVIDHPNINKIYQLYKDNHRFYIVMELCYGQSLAQMLQRQQRVEQKRAALIMHQILNVLAHCHKKGIYHSDMKLDNIIFNSQKQNVIKIVDFSISKIFRIDDIVEQSKGKVNQFFIQAFLSSPQSLTNETSSKSDIWQCGVILYILLSGQCPFIGVKKNKLMRKILYYIPTFTQKRFEIISKEAKQLIRSMLKLNPHDRPTAQMCFQHPWFQKYYRPQIISQINLKRCLFQCYHFNPSSKLQEATWTFFVSVFVPFSEKQNILHVFNKLDTLSKGEIGYDQVFHGFCQIYENQEKCHFLTEFLFTRLQKDSMTFSHFLTISTNRLFLITESNIKKVFELFDEDSSGSISVYQLKQILGSSKQVNEQVWIQLMKQADSNSDGMISFEQFRDMMKQLLKRQNQQLYELVKAQTKESDQFKLQKKESSDDGWGGY